MKDLDAKEGSWRKGIWVGPVLAAVVAILASPVRESCSSRSTGSSPRAIEGTAGGREALRKSPTHAVGDPMTGPSRAVPGAVCGVVLALAVLLTAADAHAQRPEIPDSLRAMLLQGSAVDVHVSQVQETNRSLIRLRSGAVVEATSYLGYVAYSAPAVLLLKRHSCEIYLSGNARQCRVLTAPRDTERGHKTSVSEVRANGAVLDLLLHGFYEVPMDAWQTTLWACQDVVLVGGYRLINLTDGTSVDVRPLSRR
jgi:hypothetical protein